MIIPSQFANILQAPARAALDCYERWDALRELHRLSQQPSIPVENLSEIDASSLRIALDAVGIVADDANGLHPLVALYNALRRFAAAADMPDSINRGAMAGVLVSALILWVRDGRTIADLYAENA